MGLLDNILDGAEAIVGGIEESKKLADPLPEEDSEDSEKVESKTINVESRDSRNKVIWGMDKEVSTYHLFPDFTNTALCNRYFDASQLARRTELEDGNHKCCGGCLRGLQSRYERG